ncbi:translation initiation factor IF-2-like [Manacus candei]|uniref:translation initiation factor IF-2-like n=1 Tax=Manacus candei TaxID=415023 RepID=UPI00222747EA|nr:translation initiation factor IF-2-like [Manacus candei]
MGATEGVMSSHQPPARAPASSSGPRSVYLSARPALPGQCPSTHSPHRRPFPGNEWGQPGEPRRSLAADLPASHDEPGQGGPGVEAPGAAWPRLALGPPRRPAGLSDKGSGPVSPSPAPGPCSGRGGRRWRRWHAVPKEDLQVKDLEEKFQSQKCFRNGWWLCMGLRSILQSEASRRNPYSRIEQQ